MSFVDFLRRGRADDEVRCREVQRVLQSFLDGHLADEEYVARIGRHVDACARCGLDATTYREIKDTLATLQPNPDPGAVERLEAFVRSL